MSRKRTYDDLAAELISGNIRPSLQRLKVLEYLDDHETHPTADEIYTDLQKEIPTLSKTTVYSTLSALAEADMIRVIHIGDNEYRYDIRTEDHGHFKCESCGTIYDFRVDLSSLDTDDLRNFEVRDKNVYFRGTCPNCRCKKA